MRLRAFGLALLVAAGLPAVQSCGGASSPAAPAGPVITYTIGNGARGDVGPDGKRHDTFKATSPTQVPAGSTVTVRVTNYDLIPHSFSSDDLKFQQMIRASKDGSPMVTTFSFKVAGPGTYRWYCMLPCDPENQDWAMGNGGHGMGQDGFMAGYITVA